MVGSDSIGRVGAYTQAQLDSAVATAREEERAATRAELLQKWQDPILERVSTGDPVRDKAIRFLAHMLSPAWLMARKVAAIEDLVFATTSENGVAGTQYKLRVEQLLNVMLPEGIPGEVGPKLEKPLSPDSLPSDRGDQVDVLSGVDPKYIELALLLRGQVWSADSKIPHLVENAGLPDCLDIHTV